MEPAFYISGYLEEHRELYYARLSGVSSGEKWADWLQFFLTGVVTQATRETEKVKRIMSLYSDMKDRVQGATHSQYSHKAVDAIFERPIMSGPDFTLRSKIPKPTSTTIIRVLKEAKILKTLRPAAGRRAEILVFPELMALIK